MLEVKTILAKAIENGASDVHINVGIPPVLRKNTELIIMDFNAVSNEGAKEMVLAMIGPAIGSASTLIIRTARLQFHLE
jgi:Tfp pilus assembly pilus retraction ATPase PilT